MQLLQTWIAPSLPHLTSLQRSISKMLAALDTLNPVGMLCFNQPIAPNLPRLVPSLLRSLSLIMIGSLVLAVEAADAAAAAAAAAARRRTGRRGGRRGVPLLRARSCRHCWPRSRYAPSPGSYLPCSTVAWPR